MAAATKEKEKEKAKAGKEAGSQETGQETPAPSALEFFRKTKKYAAVVKKFQGREKKVKAGSDSAKVKIIQIDVEVPVTKAIQNALNPQISALLDATAGESSEIELPLNSLDITVEQNCLAKFFSAQNYSKASEPQIICGGGNGDNCLVKLKKIIIRDHKAYLKLSLIATGTEEMWIWGWKVFGGDTNIVIETKPLQPDLPGMGGEPDDNDDEDDDEKK